MIRKYEEKDIEAVLDAWYEASLIAHSFMDAAFFEQERENVRTIYMPRANTWVYEKDEKVVGFISMVRNEVGGIFVHPEVQGQGIGTALMDKARENHKTRRFYERYGFVGVKEFIDEDLGQMQVRMRLDTTDQNHSMT